MISREDEWLHPAGPDSAWQESFYFNWADPDRRAFTLARIGYRANVRKTDGLVISLRDGELELYYGPADLDHDGPCSNEDPTKGMLAGDFRVTMEEPLSRWRLQIEGDRGMDVVFQAQTPPFDYHGDGGKLASTMTGAHFEQAGRVTGWTAFGAGRQQIDARGQRDKSWGVRDWDRLEGWNWIAGQFGPHLAFNVMQTIEAGNPLDNGFIFRDGENRAIDRCTIDYTWADHEHRMAEARIELGEAGGPTHEIRAESLGSFPILRGDVWIEETHAAYTCSLAGCAEVQLGQGVVEHVWRATPEEIHTRSARLAAIVPALRK
ncbi:MAG: hypothetical protein JRH17_09615 [Deltaproteobacteria bacterium]|nr:hypothetical protein [Deltaproteobacteria bacterium]